MKVIKKIKEKTIIQSIDSFRITNINFYTGSEDKFNVRLELLDEEENVVETKVLYYETSEFGNIFDKLFKRILKDEDLKELL
jgi:hypothetical protein